MISDEQVTGRRIGEPGQADVATRADVNALVGRQAFRIDDALAGRAAGHAREMTGSRTVAAFAMDAAIFAASLRIRLTMAI